MVDVDKLEAGPELDALVAEKVMGLRIDGLFPVQVGEGEWDVLDEDEPAHWGKRPAYRTCGDHPMPPYEYEHGSMCREVVPEYSKDIAAAWEVVRHRIPIEMGQVLFPVVRQMRHGDGELWRVDYEDKLGRVRASAEGSTAQLAICRAALMAVTHADASQQ